MKLSHSPSEKVSLATPLSEPPALIDTSSALTLTLTPCLGDSDDRGQALVDIVFRG
jgi:hypothetical protein